MLQSGVLSFRVFSNSHHIYVVVGGFHAWNGLARSYVGVQLQIFSQSNVERTVAFADRGFEGSLQSKFISFDRIQSILGDKVSIFCLRGFVNLMLFPNNVY